MEDEDQSQMKVAIAKTDLFDTQESRSSLDAGSHRHFEAHAERNENGADPQARDLAGGPREGDHGPEINSAASWRQALEREIESTDACGRRRKKGRLRSGDREEPFLDAPCATAVIASPE